MVELISSAFMGFVKGMLTFTKQCYELFTGISKTPKLFEGAVKLSLDAIPILPSSLKVFLSNNWFLTLIGGAFGTFLLAWLLFKLAMRIIQLVNPVS